MALSSGFCCIRWRSHSSAMRQTTPARWPARVAVAAEQRADRGDELLEQQARVGLVVRRVERGLEHKVGDVVLRVIDEEAARARVERGEKVGGSEGESEAEAASRARARARARRGTRA